MPLSALLVSLAVAACASGPEAYVEGRGYAGKYAGDPVFRAAVARVVGARQAALAQVADLLGLRARDPSRITVEFRDALPTGTDPLHRVTEGPFQTRTEGGLDSRVRVVIHTEALVSGEYDLEEALAHEMAHAVLRERMSGPEYRRVPVWLLEGLAVHAAGQEEQILRCSLVTLLEPGGLDRLLPGLGRAEHTFDHYAQDALAVRYLVETAGPGAPRALTLRLAAGEPPREALTAVAGAPYAEFLRRADTFSRERLLASRPPEWPQVERLSALHRGGEHAALRAEAEGFLARHPRSAYAPEVLGWHANACRRLGDPEAAEASLRRALAGFPRATCSGWDGVWFQLGTVLLARGDPDGAARCLETVLRDHPGTTIQDAALLELARAELARGDPLAALARLELLGRSYPAGPFAAAAARLRAEVEAVVTR